MVYLIHTGWKHYIGYCSESGLSKRVKTHLLGQGSAVPYAAFGYGYTVQVVRTWKNGSRDLERQLKNRRNHKHFCPVCNPAMAEHKYNGRKHTADEVTQARIKRVLLGRQANWKVGPRANPALVEAQAAPLKMAVNYYDDPPF